MEFTLGRRRGLVRIGSEDGAWEQEENARQAACAADGGDGIDWGDGYDVAETRRQPDDIDRMQLPTKRRRQYMTLFTVLTMIIAAASCILVLLLMKGQSESDAVNNARNQALEDKLTTIEASLGALDQSVVRSGDTTAASASAQYQELGATVDSLRTNLTDYRDNNEIQNEEIGDHLDRVIAQLDRIKEDMTAQQAQDDAEDSALGSRLDSLSESSKTGTGNLTKELDAVHKDIAALIDAAGDDQTGNYKELKGILTATDASLSDLVADKFDETGTLISSSMARLQSSIAGVSDDVASSLSGVKDDLSGVTSGLSDVSAGMTTGLASVGNDITGVNTSLAGVNESLSSIAGNIGGIDMRVNKVQDSVEDLLDALDDLADQNAEADDTILAHMDTVRADITAFRTDLSDRVTLVTDQLAAIKTVVDESLATGNLGKETLAALTQNVDLLQDALEDTTDDVQAVDRKLDKIIEAMEIDAPAPDPEPDPDPTPVPEPDPDPEPTPEPVAETE